MHQLQLQHSHGVTDRPDLADEQTTTIYTPILSPSFFAHYMDAMCRWIVHQHSESAPATMVRWSEQHCRAFRKTSAAATPHEWQCLDTLVFGGWNHAQSFMSSLTLSASTTAAMARPTLAGAVYPYAWPDITFAAAAAAASDGASATVCVDFVGSTLHDFLQSCQTTAGSLHLSWIYVLLLMQSATPPNRAAATDPGVHWLGLCTHRLCLSMCAPTDTCTSTHQRWHSVLWLFPAAIVFMASVLESDGDAIVSIPLLDQTVIVDFLWMVSAWFRDLRIYRPSTIPTSSLECVVHLRGFVGRAQCWREYGSVLHACLDTLRREYLPAMLVPHVPPTCTSPPLVPALTRLCADSIPAAFLCAVRDAHLQMGQMQLEIMHDFLRCHTTHAVRTHAVPC